LSGQKKTILLIGGSLGARTLNNSIAAGLQQLAGNNIQLIWQTGKAFFPKAQELTTEFSSHGISAYDFIQRMDYAFAAADVVISRAGASSVSELALVAKPSILVPSPNVAEDHQTKNAMSLVKKNAAVLVTDADAATKLITEAIGLISDQSRQDTLRDNISKLALNNSAEVIAEQVYGISGK